MSPIHVVGIGLEGADGLSQVALQSVEKADLLVGSDRHLSYFPAHPAHRLVLGNFTDAIAHIRQHLAILPSLTPCIVILTSGDPLFYGIGRLLLEEFPPDQLTFHPHISSMQLAFSRVKLSWQDARLISVHGRSLEELIQTLQQGVEKIAVLTDSTNTPAAIAQLIQSLQLPLEYRLWICENLGGIDERVTELGTNLDSVPQSFAPLNVVILHRLAEPLSQPDLCTLPLLGISDSLFLSFRDRPGLITKREVRVVALGELALQPDQTVWDIGAGTGSVSIEIARLCPTSQIYAIEKTAAGQILIKKNCQRFQVENVVPVPGIAPEALDNLPRPDRIFIGGSGGTITQILAACSKQLQPNGRIVLALATLEHLTATLSWLATQSAAEWNHHLLQVQLSRSVPIAALTRFSPLNPVTLVIIERRSPRSSPRS